MKQEIPQLRKSSPHGHPERIAQPREQSKDAVLLRFDPAAGFLDCAGIDEFAGLRVRFSIRFKDSNLELSSRIVNFASRKPRSRNDGFQAVEAT
jgi:hypothetical protein